MNCFLIILTTLVHLCDRQFKSRALLTAAQLFELNADGETMHLIKKIANINANSISDILVNLFTPLSRLKLDIYFRTTIGEQEKTLFFIYFSLPVD